MKIIAIIRKNVKLESTTIKPVAARLKLVHFAH